MRILHPCIFPVRKLDRFPAVLVRNKKEVIADRINVGKAK